MAINDRSEDILSLAEQSKNGQAADIFITAKKDVVFSASNQPAQIWENNFSIL